MRFIIAAIAGFVVWMLVATVAGLPLRWFWPAYAAVEKAYGFTLAMLLARLAIGAAATLFGGFVAAAIDARRGAIAVGILLMLFFVPIHIGLGAKFPLWYHLVFLASLLPLSLAGGRLRAGRA